MRPLRILTVGHSYSVELNRSVMERIARDPRVEVTVVAPQFFHGDLRPITLEPSSHASYDLVGLPAHFSRYIHLFYYSGLDHVIESGYFDLIHAWQEPYIVAGFQVARAAGRAGIPYFFRTAQSLPKRYPPPFAQFERYCVEQSHGWVAGGTLVQRALLNRGYPRNNAEIITLGVDDDAFYPDKTEGAAIRRQLGLDDAPTIGFMGRLRAAKGLDVLMAALEGVPGRWNLLVLGSGPYAVKIQSWAKAHGWSDRVRVLLVKHGEVPSYLRAMDILTVPSQTTRSWKEQFGRVIVEAFATGIPVIGSDSGEIPFLLDGVGLVVGEQDTLAWSKAIADLCDAPGWRKALGEASRDRCHELYSASRVAQRYLAYYRRLTDNGPSMRHSPDPDLVAQCY